MTKPKPKHVFFFGCARGGTSIIWDCLRKDNRLLCFDEPFSPDIRWRVRCKQDNEVGSRAEFIEHPSPVLSHWSPMPITEQNDRSIMYYQLDYLNELVDEGDHVVMKLMGAHAKIKAIREFFYSTGELLTVFIIRDPRGFVTSHLLPAGPMMVKSANVFFRKFGISDNTWGYEQLAGIYGIRDKLAVPRFTKLWEKICTDAIDQKPDMAIVFERFTVDPKAQLARIYERLGMEPPDGIDYGEVHVARIGYEPDHSGWDPAVEAHERVIKIAEGEGLV